MHSSMMDYLAEVRNLKINTIQFFFIRLGSVTWKEPTFHKVPIFKGAYFYFSLVPYSPPKNCIWCTISCCGSLWAEFVLICFLICLLILCEVRILAHSSQADFKSLSLLSQFSSFSVNLHLKLRIITVSFKNSVKQSWDGAASSFSIP